MTGRKGENFAVLYLLLHGYRIVERNYHSRFGEIDIIAKKSDTIAFVEVKTRGENPLYTPREAVNIYKQKKIIKTAQRYIMYHNIDDYNLRFDVIEIYNKGILFKINHILNAFEC